MGRDGSRKRIRRSLALGAVVLHALLAVVLPYADAGRNAPAGPHAPHIAESDKRPTAPAHDHTLCQFCRSLGTVAVLPPVVTGNIPAITVPVLMTAAAKTAELASHHSSKRTRAPPIA